MGASFRFCSGGRAHTRRTAHEQGGGSAASQCLRLRIHAPKPHEQGAWALRFVSVPAAERIHGGRPTSRGRPPAAVGGRETGENGRWFPKTAAGGKSLLVDLPPSAPTPAPTDPHRSTPAPCSWGGCASTRSRRHWPPALPAPCSWGGCASTRSHRHCQPALPAEFNLQAPLQTPSSRYNNGRNALKGTASASPFPKRAGNGASPAEGRGGDRPGAAGRTRMRQ